MGTEADLIKQSCGAEAEAAEAGKIISINRNGIIGEPLLRTACIVSVKAKILATLRKAGEYIYSSEILLSIAKFRDCLSKVRVKNSLLNERSKTLMLQMETSFRLTLERKRLNGSV